MAVSFNNALSTLKSMFPDMDEAILSDIMISNDYHIERTVEQVLTLTLNEDSSSPQTESGSFAAAAPAPKAAPQPATRPQHRGNEVKLHDDFLQVSGKGQATISEDEELAMMMMMAERQEVAKRAREKRERRAAKGPSVFESAKQSVSSFASKFRSGGHNTYTSTESDTRHSSSLLQSHSDEHEEAENPLLMRSSKA